MRWQRQGNVQRTIYGGNESKDSPAREREREEVYAALQYAASFSLSGGEIERL